MPVGLKADALQQLDQLAFKRSRIKKGESLYRHGDTFTALYAIRRGTFKRLMLTEDGREQITGYHMAGEIVGLDGISSDRYACQATALEDG